MANNYKDITLPLHEGSILKLNCHYTYVKNRKRYNHILFLSYKIVKWPEFSVNLDIFMQEYINEFVYQALLPIQCSSVRWTKIVLKSIPSTITLHYNLDLKTHGHQEQSPDPSQYFKFEMQQKSNNVISFNLFGVASNIQDVSADSLLTSEQLILDPVVLKENAVSLVLKGLKKPYDDSFISVASRGFKTIIRKKKAKKKATSGTENEKSEESKSSEEASKSSE